MSGRSAFVATFLAPLSYWGLNAGYLQLLCRGGKIVVRPLIKSLEELIGRKLEKMLVKKAEYAIRRIMREFMYVEGSNCAEEAALKGKLDGYREAFQLARLVKEDRFDELFAQTHMEVHGMTQGAKSMHIGVSVQQLTTNDWEKFDSPTLLRRRTKS